MNKVFAYGILQDIDKAYLIDRPDCIFKKVSTDVYPIQKYIMKEHGAPMVAPDDQGDPIRGTLLEVSDSVLEKFDRMEANGVVYARVVRKMSDGSTAWVYEANPSRREAYFKGIKLNNPDDDGFVRWSGTKV